MSASEGPAFVDTNILVYALDKTPSPRKTPAQALILRLTAEDRLRISTQVLQELFVTLTRKVPQACSPDEAISFLDQLSVWPLFLIDFPAIHDAALLSRDAGISFWDALIVVAAARSGANSLYTEDLSHGEKLLGVEIVNPFREVV